MEPWQCMCPECGENIYIGIDPYYIGRCDKCGTRWTLGELEVYEMSHPSKETIEIVNKLMKLSRDIAMEKS